MGKREKVYTRWRVPMNCKLKLVGGNDAWINENRLKMDVEVSAKEGDLIKSVECEIEYD
jgi:hypothetical protein